MHEILRALPAGSKVLDLGSGGGSFDETVYPLMVIHADLDTPRSTPRNFIQCSAAALPFPDRYFDAVISNHSFEHFEDLDAAIKELARILAPSALIYIAVPDSSTLTDRIYRWLARGGGHVNAFSDVHTLPRLITAATSIPLAQTRVLCTSFVWLNRRNWPGRPPRKLLLLGNGNENTLRILVFLLRTMDRWLGTRTSVYGWAYFFGNLAGVDSSVSSNVCIGCGSAHSTDYLSSLGRIEHRRFLPAKYACPSCSTVNFYTDDRDFQKLR